AVDVVDGAPDELPEVGSQDQRTDRRIGILDRGDLFVELRDDVRNVQAGEIVDLGNRSAQQLLYADQVRYDRVDLIGTDTADYSRRCIVEQIRCCQSHCFSPASAQTKTGPQPLHASESLMPLRGAFRTTCGSLRTQAR